MVCRLQPAQWERPPAAGVSDSASAAAPAAEVPPHPPTPPRLPPLRGMAAPAEGLAAGALALALPSQLLISYDTAAASELGMALARLPPLQGDPESLAVVWTMVERWDEEADAAPFWCALPSAFHTGAMMRHGGVGKLYGW
jgi:hypothetical protein